MPTQTNLMASGCPALQAQASVGILTNNVSGAGSSSQANATAIISDLTVVTTAAANSGVRLPADSGQLNIGDSYIVVNHGANSLSVYPATGGKIANGSINAAFAVAANKVAQFFYLGATNQWSGSLSA